MGYVDMDTITMDKRDYNYWKNNGDVYLQFDFTQKDGYRLYTYEELVERYNLRTKFLNEDDFIDTTAEQDTFLYNEGYYLFDDRLEEDDDETPIWSTTAIGDKVVVSRAYLWS